MRLRGVYVVMYVCVRMFASIFFYVCMDACIFLNLCTLNQSDSEVCTLWWIIRSYFFCQSPASLGYPLSVCNTKVYSHFNMWIHLMQHISTNRSSCECVNMRFVDSWHAVHWFWSWDRLIPKKNRVISESFLTMSWIYDIMFVTYTIHVYIV